MLGCNQHAPAKLILPQKGVNEKIFFNNFHKQIEKPYVMYGDIESFTTKTEQGMKGTYQHHKASCLSYTVVDRINNTTPELKTFDNEKDFLRSVFKDASIYCT